MMHAPGLRLRVVLVLVDRNFHLRFASAVADAACAVDVAFHLFRYWRSSQANCESTARKTPSLPPSVVPMKLSSSSSLVGGLVPSCTCIITHQRSSPSALIIIIIISSSSLPSSSLIPHPSLPPLHFSPLESPVTVLLQVRSGRYTSRTQSYAATCTSY